MRTVWSKADIHVHTTHSDGHAGVEEVLEHAVRRTDLRVIAITDHNTVEGALEARSLAEAYGMEVVVGEEVSTADGELLALFIEQRLPPGLPAAETIDAVHEQGGLAVAAHPYHWLAPSVGRRDLLRRVSGSDPEWPLDAIEVFNAGLLLSRGNRRAVATAVALGLPAVGGSDSHHPKTLGYGHSLFPGRGARDLRAAIESGQTYAAGHRWGPIRIAEIIGLIVRRELRDPAKWVRSTKDQTSPPSLVTAHAPTPGSAADESLNSCGTGTEQPVQTYVPRTSLRAMHKTLCGRTIGAQEQARETNR